MKISLIAAHGKSRQIGLKGQIPFKSDLKRFKYLTLGKTLLMGRKTYESIGKHLPGREMIVITKKTDFNPKHVFVANTMEDAVQLAKLLKTTELMIAGGQEVYEFFMPIADRAYITTIDYDGPADTYFPQMMGSWSGYYIEEDGEGSFEIYNRSDLS